MLRVTKCLPLLALLCACAPEEIDLLQSPGPFDSIEVFPFSDQAPSRGLPDSTGSDFWRREEGLLVFESGKPESVQARAYWKVHLDSRYRLDFDGHIETSVPPDNATGIFRAEAMNQAPHTAGLHGAQILPFENLWYDSVTEKGTVRRLLPRRANGAPIATVRITSRSAEGDVRDVEDRDSDGDAIGRPEDEMDVELGPGVVHVVVHAGDSWANHKVKATVSRLKLKKLPVRVDWPLTVSAASALFALLSLLVAWTALRHSRMNNEKVNSA